MNTSVVPPRRKFFYPLLISLLICAVIVIAAWTATSSPVLGLNSTATPTPSNPFALVEIGKPTYTATPTATVTPTVIPTNTSEPTAIAELVAEQTAQNAYQAPAQSYSGNKYILVDISEQHMYVYEGDTIVYSFVSSTGMNNATRVGLFSVLDKIPNAYGATWNIWMPNWLGIYYSGHLENGIHALPILSNGATLWEGYLGVPISYGCIVLGTYESQVLYDWAEIGTPVEIQR